jgi:hypothetical protein
MCETKNFIHKMWKRAFFVLARLSRDCAEAWQRHAAQVIPKTYAARAEKYSFHYLPV